MNAQSRFRIAGLLGSTGWGLWVAALGVTVLLRPIAGATPRTGATPICSTVNKINETDGVDGVGAIDTPLFEGTPATTRPTEAGLRTGTP